MSSTAEEFAGPGGFLYHVPQHSRREKLRFPTDDSPVATTISLPLLHQSNAAFLPSFYYNHNFDDCGPYQIQPQGFSLSLSPATIGPLGPFTGYAAVLNRSGFVEPARQLLEEICRLGRGEFASVGGRDLTDDMTMESEVERVDAVEEENWKKVKLLSMLDEVYRRYRLYYQQVETVIASFETVAGLNTAAPYISFALKSMSKNFRSLKNLISNHLNNLGKINVKEGLGKGEFTGFGLTATGDHSCTQRRNSSLSFGQTQVWRPQRGLPERAVAVLRAWLFEHFLHPYPTDTDKQMLAKQTGLTRNQVSNWFINARVRLWKPMVEEIHNLEMHQLQKTVETDHNVQNPTFQASQPSSSSAATSSSNPAPVNNFMQRTSQNQSYRPANIEQLPHIEEPYKFIFDNDFACHSQPVGVEIGGNSVVSLTLGLPEPLSVNVARRFGLEECSNAYVLGGFEGGQERHYGKEIGAHLLHDFVG
ncbi:hypothetical protein KFK09_001064 [Dendrobium nobile]|uniref:Homeobox domain-containing protein n=1 Tax=Dendrobium nobile TaxID=94219 RepID=A0A8T3CAC0_DENNO|nr:hypothetical protein KFK09_001064 [Dendrobium nobile]